MVGAANLPTLPEEHPPPVRVKCELIQAARDGVGFDPYGRDGPRVKHVGGGNQHPEGRVGGEEDTMVAVKKAIGRGGHVGIKLYVAQVAILIGPVSLVAHRLEGEPRGPRFI